MIRHARTRIVSTVTHHRPAVIPSRQDNIEFVSSIRTILVLPNHACFRMNRQSQRVAMTERKDLRLVTGSANERIIGRRRSVVAKAENFTAMIHWILRALIESASHRHEQISIRRKHDSRCGCTPIVYGVGDKDIANIGERMTIEPPSRERRRDALLQRLGIREVDQLVVREPRMQRNVQESAQLLRKHSVPARKRIWIKHAVFY